MFKFFITKSREYIFIILTATIFYGFLDSKSLANENVFVVDNVKVEGEIKLNFSREKFINKAFLYSFDILKSKILLTRDLNKLGNLKIKEIKKIIKSFQLIDEKYDKKKYHATFKVTYDDEKVKKLLEEKSISFSNPDEISVIFFPMLFVDNEFVNFKNNYFYQNWKIIEVDNKNINFILPLEDLDDISKIKDMRNNIEELTVEDFVNKYDVKNYVFVFFDYNKKLKIHLKTNFKSIKMSKNIYYELDSIQNESKLNSISLDLKKKIIEEWKEVNVVNLSMPLSITIKFKHSNLLALDHLKNVLKKINIVENSSLEEFSVQESIFKIYYFGSPKKLKTQLLKHGYNLKDDKGYWELYKNG